MSETKKFRSALNGFNRQDVVQYIEYMTNRHTTQVKQLNAQLKAAQEKPEKELAQCREQLAQLQEQLQAKEDALCALTEQLASTEAQLRAMTPQPESPVPAQEAPVPCTAEQELEAYRRAERAERMANERANAVYDRANAILADVTVQADEYAKATDSAFVQLVSAMDAYKAALALNRPKLDEAARTLSAIRATE